jgi:hypothetical protein
MVHMPCCVQPVCMFNYLVSKFNHFSMHCCFFVRLGGTGWKALCFFLKHGLLCERKKSNVPLQRRDEWISLYKSFWHLLFEYVLIMLARSLSEKAFVLFVLGRTLLTIVCVLPIKESTYFVIVIVLIALECVLE